MQKSYKVSNVSRVPVAVQATVEGQQMTVTTDCLEVELVAQDGRSGSTTLRFVGDEIHDAAARLQQDAVVSFTLA